MPKLSRPVAGAQKMSALAWKRGSTWSGTYPASTTFSRRRLATNDSTMPRSGPSPAMISRVFGTRSCRYW